VRQGKICGKTAPNPGNYFPLIFTAFHQRVPALGIFTALKDSTELGMVLVYSLNSNLQYHEVSLERKKFRMHEQYTS